LFALTGAIDFSIEAVHMDMLYQRIFLLFPRFSCSTRSGLSTCTLEIHVKWSTIYKNRNLEQKKLFAFLFTTILTHNFFYRKKISIKAKIFLYAIINIILFSNIPPDLQFLLHSYWLESYWLYWSYQNSL